MAHIPTGGAACPARWAVETGVIPGEPYNDLAGTAFALVVGYANDYLGYFPTQSAIDDQTYEALSSPHDARAHHLLAAALRTMY